MLTYSSKHNFKITSQLQDRFQMVNKWEVHKVWTFTVSLAGSFLNILHFPPLSSFPPSDSINQLLSLYILSLSLSLSFPGIINQLLSPSSTAFVQGFTQSNLMTDCWVFSPLFSLPLWEWCRVGLIHVSGLPVSGPLTRLSRRCIRVFLFF